MRKMFWKFLRDKKGSVYIDTSVFLWVVLMSLALALSVFAFSWRKSTAQDFADYAARQIAADGAFSNATVQRLTQVAGNGHFSIEVKTADGYDMSVPICTDTALNTEEIQQGTAFSVYITSLDQNVIGVGGVQTNSVTVYGTAGGVSARYWKG
ncbi:MAG: DUF4320 family protein [Ethanoligenens sp.]